MVKVIDLFKNGVIRISFYYVFFQVIIWLKIIYANLECLLKKMSTCINNLNESSTTKINKHTPSGYSIFTSCSFDESKNKLNYYRGKDCMKKFCEDLRIHGTKIINYEKKKIIPLTMEEKINYNDQKVCYICKKEFDNI